MCIDIKQAYTINILAVYYIIDHVHIPVNCMCICTGKCSCVSVFV